MSSSFRVPPIRSSSETDIFVLLQTVWQQRIIVIVAALFVGLLAAGYVFMAVPEYQVSSVLRPAAINELDALNRSEIYILPPEEALMKVGASLDSYDTRLGFFRANTQLFHTFERPGRTLEQSFEQFNGNSFSLMIPDSKKADILSTYIKIEMKYPKGVDGVSILNGFVDYAIQIERQRIAADFDVIVKNRLVELDGKLAAARASYNVKKKAEIASLAESDALRKAQLQDELKALRSELKTRRGDRVAQLNEAIGIAKSLDIRKPSTPASLAERARDGASSVVRTEINNQQIPLYFMGVEALQAERTALLQRKTDDFSETRISKIANELQLLQSNRRIELLNRRKNEDLFLDGVEPVRAEAARLRNLNIDMKSLKLVVIDKEAVEPLSPLASNKVLVIILGLFLGGVLGVIFAFVRSSSEAHRKTGD